MRMAPIPIVQRLIPIGIRYAGGGKRIGAALPRLVASTVAPEPESLRIGDLWHLLDLRSAF